MSPGMSVSNVPPAFTMHRCDMWSMNPKKVSKLVDNKRLPLLTTKAKSTSSSLGTKKMEEKDNKLQVTNAKNKDFLDFFTGALPPWSDYHFIPPVYDCSSLSAYKTLAEELALSTTFAEAAYIYPSSTETLDAAFTYARNFQSLANGKIHMQPTIEYISLSNNIPKTSPPFEDIGEVEKRISEGKVGVVFVEPIHGNGGLKSFPPEHLRSLRTVCDKAGTLLAFDEVQCGLGQTGWLWVHQAVGVKPDMMMVQFRGLGIGALVVNKRLNGYKHIYESNEHMMRECGNALKIFRNVRQRGYSAIVKRKGRYFEEIMTKQLYGVSNVGPIRAFGLLVAMELCIDAQSFVDKCKENGLGFVYAGKGNMVRILPPFNVNAHELDDAVAIMKECLRCPDDWVRPADYYPYYL